MEEGGEEKGKSRGREGGNMEDGRGEEGREIIKDIK